jgi:hypothetical protein
MNRKTEDEAFADLQSGLDFFRQLAKGGDIELGERCFPWLLEEAHEEGRTWTDEDGTVYVYTPPKTDEEINERLLAHVEARFKNDVW